jgi:hypothetical protein
VLVGVFVGGLMCFSNMCVAVLRAACSLLRACSFKPAGAGC